MSNAPRLLPAAAVAAALLVAGCGGGGSDASSITKAEFIEKADSICAKGQEKVKADYVAFLKEHKEFFLKEHKGPLKQAKVDYAELAEAVLVPNVREEVDALRALGAPGGEVGRVTAIVEAFEERLEAIEEEPETAFAPFIKAEKLAKEYGLKVCDGK